MDFAPTLAPAAAAAAAMPLMPLLGLGPGDRPHHCGPGLGGRARLTLFTRFSRLPRFPVLTLLPGRAPFPRLLAALLGTAALAALLAAFPTLSVFAAPFAPLRTTLPALGLGRG